MPSAVIVTVSVRTMAIALQPYMSIPDPSGPGKRLIQSPGKNLLAIFPYSVLAHQGHSYNTSTTRQSQKDGQSWIWSGQESLLQNRSIILAPCRYHTVQIQSVFLSLHVSYLQQTRSSLLVKVTKTHCGLSRLQGMRMTLILKGRLQACLRVQRKTDEATKASHGPTKRMKK